MIVADSADEFRFVPVLWAALIALVEPWPLHLLTSWSTDDDPAASGGRRSCWSRSRSLIRRCAAGSCRASIAAAASRKAAQALFMTHGLHLTEKRTGVLIYVALADRRVEIVADAGINSKVEQSAWDELARDVVDRRAQGCSRRRARGRGATRRRAARAALPARPARSQRAAGPGGRDLNPRTLSGRL